MQVYSLIARRTFFSSQAILPILAFAASAASLLTVAGGIQAFYLWVPYRATGASAVYREAVQMAPFYQFCAWFAGLLLIFPLFTLGASAARLSARRRDDRLATLRLLGASTARLTMMTVLDALAYALIGFVLGVGLYALLIQPLGTLRFQGFPLQARYMALSPKGIGYCALFFLVVATVSSLFGLSKVSISPLGVRQRVSAAPLSRRLLVGALVIFGAAIVLSVLAQSLMQSTAQAGVSYTVLLFIVALILGLPVLLGMVAMDLLGTFVVGLYAKIAVKRTSKPHALLAYRAILESPRAAWRQVSGVAMSTFTVAFLGPIFSIIAQVSRASQDVAQSTLVADMWQGLFLLLSISFVLVAISALLNQSAAIFERSSLYSSLHMMGASRRVLGASRRLVVMGPLVLVSTMSAAAALLLVGPLMGSALSGVSLLYTLGLVLASIVVGVLLVHCALLATAPLLRSVTSKPVSAL
ncbi:MAG: FtsX-like permease family protein [Rothia sp. (in: high G+C Gram-positive bacteria)]|uniref:FtsX-like permease family protein n=1 Tax=Rothia sp. (in: high G+C Gram-positive bacteria) TaxID=1885016 RepID=UPI0026DF9F60|nr:FtsX-like permease family protein [Rothia sp. (in: high G+C Gram-positive bacteria)]MDO5749799.1 FtsX-like permease family protein [Rothia sp. (in: high G+C Gram-positive bacteria)]